MIVVIMVIYAGLATAAFDAPVTNGLFAALDGSDIIASGRNVSSWNDQATQWFF